MSKTVTIPTDGMNPFVVIFNGVNYVYTPGETVTVPDGVALEIEEYKRWRDKYYGITPKPFGAQPDLSQNDPDAADYVKNRTHYVEKAFEDITWDGDTEGRNATEVFHSSGYYKVSDQIPTAEALNGATVERFDGVIVEINEDELTQRAEEVLACHNPHVLIISAPTTWEGMSFPSAGVYFWKYDSGAQVMHTHSLKAKETVHKLDPKYLPDDIGGEKYDMVIYYPGSSDEMVIEQGSFEAVKAKILASESVNAKVYNVSYRNTYHCPVLRIMYDEEDEEIEITVLSYTGEVLKLYWKP